MTPAELWLPEREPGDRGVPLPLAGTTPGEFENTCPLCGYPIAVGAELYARCGEVCH